jgi:hypothetical protein
LSQQDDQQQQQQQQQQLDSVQVATSAAAAGDGSGDPFLQQQQQQGDDVSILQPPQQLLLVATKVTGDRNVPAGQVTFAVDLGSRSSAGAGQLLQLPPPPHIHSAVELNAPGTRPLKLKVCVNCRKQYGLSY